MNKDWRIISVRDFKNGFRGINFDKKNLVAHQKTLYDVWSHVQELGVHQKEIAEYFASIWNFSTNHTNHVIGHRLVCPRDWEIRTYSAGMNGKVDKTKTNGELDSQRLSDYLHFLGYEESELRQIFDSLHNLSADFSYRKPNPLVKVHSNALEWQKSRKYENSLDSLEGLGDFEW